MTFDTGRITFKSRDTRRHRMNNGIELTGEPAALIAWASTAAAGLHADVARVSQLVRTHDPDEGDQDYPVGSAISAYLQLRAGRYFGKMSLQDIVAGTSNDAIAAVLSGHVKIGRHGPLCTSVSVRQVDLNSP